MALNKLALIRYKTIDNCLINRKRKWTLENLIETVSEAIYEFEGITTGVSVRTIQKDLELMRSDKLGYNAPIIVVNRKFYTYENANYSITNAPINASDLNQLTDAVTILKQLSGFSHFNNISEIITKLEGSINSKLSNTIPKIQYETNNLLTGIQFLNPLYKAVSNKVCIMLEYKSFKAKSIQTFVIYPYLLKEYRNRWFLICKIKNKTNLFTLALDRILNVQTIENEKFIEYTGVDWGKYYRDVIGVTKSERDRPSKIIFKILKDHVPYLITKPLHDSQNILKQEPNGDTIFRIDVVLNFELEKEFLSFGEIVEVLSPQKLRKNLAKRLTMAQQIYFNKN